jgi:hypothetical protein
MITILFFVSVFLCLLGLIGLWICLDIGPATEPGRIIHVLNVSLVCFVGLLISLLLLIMLAFYEGVIAV